MNRLIDYGQEAPLVSETKPADTVLALASSLDECQQERVKIVAGLKALDQRIGELENQLVETLRYGRESDPRIDIIKRAVGFALKEALSEQEQRAVEMRPVETRTAVY